MHVLDFDHPACIMPLMKAIAHALYTAFARLGGLGLLGLGILDSSFLFMPLGKDVLMVVLTIQNHSRMFYYAVMASVGSMVGSLILDLIFRKAGENGLEKHVAPRRLKYVKRKLKSNAAWALVVACLAPPPFPFTPFVSAAAALQYPRRKMLLLIAGARFIRYIIVGGLAIKFGTLLLSWAESRALQVFVIGLVALSVVGSIVSVIS